MMHRGEMVVLADEVQRSRVPTSTYPGACTCVMHELIDSPDLRQRRCRKTACADSEFRPAHVSDRQTSGAPRLHT